MVEMGYRKALLEGPISHWLNHARWISALLVAMSHLRNTLFPDVSIVPKALYPFYFFNLLGGQAVVVFFVMSGLLVGGIVIRTSNEFSYKQYFIARAVRLYLVLIPAVMLAVGLQWLLPSSCVHPNDMTQILGNLLFLQNFTTAPLCND